MAHQEEDVLATHGDAQSSEANAMSASCPQDSATSFLSLPSELRNAIYDLVLLHQEPLNPWADYGHRPLTLGLLCTSRAVRDETRSLFYGSNTFNFTTAEPESLATFLQDIGSSNAGCIQHIRIKFPEFLRLERGNVTLEDDCLAMFASIVDRCTNVNTLTTSRISTHTMELTLRAVHDNNISTEALTLANTTFRAIPSLQEINVDLFKSFSGDHIRGVMGDLGWNLNIRAYGGEFDEDSEDLMDFDDFDDFEEFFEDYFDDFLDDYGGAHEGHGWVRDLLEDW